MTTPESASIKEEPIVHYAYPSLIRGRQEIKVRVIQYSKSGPLLDLRDYQATPTPQFTRKGVTLSVSQLLKLREHIDEIIDKMINLRT